MTDATNELAKKASQGKDNGRKATGENIALDCCYGQIGISAVAAAVRYQGSAKNPAYAPASNQWRDRLADVAA